MPLWPTRRPHHPHRRKIRGAGYFRRLGPGIVTGAADDDPSGIGTYSQVGASQGYQYVWTAPVLLPLAFAVQEQSARVALVTGKGLAGLIKAHFPRPVLWFCVVLVVSANIANIAADLASMGAVVSLLAPVPQWLAVVVLGAGIAAAEILVRYRRYEKVLRWLCLSLLAYFAVLAVANVDWLAVASSLIPSVDLTKVGITVLIALAGTTISPYLFFWQAAEEVEEEGERAPDLSDGHVRAMRGDVFAGMLSGVLVMFAIMTATAATLYTSAGGVDIQSADQAAEALAPLVGNFASLLFSLGILGTGLLAVPVLAGSTAYAVSETMGWPEGLGRKPTQAALFYISIVVAIAIGVSLTAVGVNPIQGLYLAAVLNGLAAPVLLLVLWKLGRDHGLLGRWRSGAWSQTVVGLTALVMIALPVAWFLVD